VRPRRTVGSVIILATLLLGYTPLLLGNAPRPPVRLVSDVWPPFSDVEGKPRQAIDLVDAALRRGGLKTSSVIVPWSTVMTVLQRGHADGSPTMWKTAERESDFIFSKPYLENRLILVARKGVDVSATSASQLAGKRLVLTRGYAYGPEVTQAPSVLVSYLDGDADCLRAVLSQKADYLLLDELTLDHLFAMDSARADRLISRGTVALETHGLHFALSKTYPRAQEIINAFDRDVERMVADGSYNSVLHVPWIQTDTDGDGELEYVASSRSVVRPDQDPYTTHGGYPLFHGSAHAPSTGRAPEYVIDGKSYDTWGDAATTLQRQGATQPEGAYKFSTGFVLGEF
jgi:polar amino acid transport system substrate-binding protein